MCVELVVLVEVEVAYDWRWKHVHVCVQPDKRFDVVRVLTK